VLFIEIRKKKKNKYFNPFDISCNFKWNIAELLENLEYLHGVTRRDLDKFQYFQPKLHLHKPQPLGKFAIASQDI